MELENLNLDAADPIRLGRFWAAALGATRLDESADLAEYRLDHGDGAVLDLCLQRVTEPQSAGPRMHFDLRGGAEQQAIVDRLLALGASHLDIGQVGVPWVVLADPEGNAFCVMEERAPYVAGAPIAAIPIDSRDPARDEAFWAELSGWAPADGIGPASLRHPSGRGPLLEFCPEPAPKSPVKNRMHLDLRLATDDDPAGVAARIAELGGALLDPGWGELPWRVFADPSGNEFCVLSSHEAG